MTTIGRMRNENFNALWTSRLATRRPTIIMLCFSLPTSASRLRSTRFLRARQLDPVSGLIAADAAWVFYLKRDYDQFMEQAKAAVELAPDYWLGHLQLGLAYEKKGDFARALQELEEARRMDDNSGVLEMLAGTYAAAGRPDQARRITEEMVKRSKKRYVCAYEVATTYAGLKDHESAFLWLRKSLDERADCSSWVAADPKLDALRDDPLSRPPAPPGPSAVNCAGRRSTRI
jgi:tetratricopeptide (TPR) repeat protein